MIVTPSLTVTANPVASIVAIDVSSDLQVTPFVKSAFWPAFSEVPRAEYCTLSPSVVSQSSGVTEMEASRSALIVTVDGSLAADPLSVTTRANTSDRETSAVNVVWAAKGSDKVAPLPDGLETMDQEYVRRSAGFGSSLPLPSSATGAPVATFWSGPASATGGTFPTFTVTVTVSSPLLAALLSVTVRPKM